MSKVFISYSSLDSKKVDILKDALNRLGHTPIIIAEKKEPLKELSQKVIEGIEEADFFVPIITPQSISAQWLNQEIGYAKARKPEKILPIVQTGVLAKLVGFVHKDIDLPFQYNERNFRRCAENLVEYIDGQITGKVRSIIDVFFGRWKNEFSDNVSTAQEVFEIREGNKYFIENKHWFNIEDFKYEKSTHEVTFRKVGVNDNRILQNRLEKKGDNCWEGTEYNNLDQVTRKVKYTKEG